MRFNPSTLLSLALICNMPGSILAADSSTPRLRTQPAHPSVTSPSAIIQQPRGKPANPGNPPRVSNMRINNGAQYTSDRTVVLDHNVQGTPTFYRAAESSNLNNLPWLPYVSSPTYTLSAGNGAKTVYMQLRNGSANQPQGINDSGVSGTKNDTITLMNPRVISLTINNGQSSTNSYSVTLNNTVEGAASHYRASQNPNFAGASWQPYTNVPSFTLTGAQGQKNIYFQVRAGNDLSNVISDSINISFNTEYRIPGALAYDYARAHGFNFAAKGDPPSKLASCFFSKNNDVLFMYTQHVASVPAVGAGPLGASCLFELFTGKTLNEGWRISGADIYSSSNYSWNKSISSNTNDASFKIHVDKSAGAMFSADTRLFELVLIGPKNANWEDAFN
jgi:hypothetical protein